MKTTTIIFLIFLGIFFWLSNYDIINFSRDWPVILIVVGLLAIVKRKKRRKKIKTNRTDDTLSVLKDLEDGRITAPEAEKKIKD